MSPNNQSKKIPNAKHSEDLSSKLSNNQLKNISPIQPIMNDTRHILQPSQSVSSPCCPSPTASDTNKSCCTPSPMVPSPPNGNTQPGVPCCGPRIMPKLNYIAVSKQKQNGVPVVDAKLSAADRIGGFRARIGNYRMNYAIAPGLYALGNPTKTSEILVSANYKLSFDHLRQSLLGQNVWILVLNTYGINVWCAAGKGTFGTEELITQIQAAKLTEKVTTRRIIVPQLGAPGVAGHIVARQTGFKVVWGPIEAKDLPSFLNNHFKATPAMRQKQFSLAERFVLIPIELRPAAKTVLQILAVAAPLCAIAFPGAYLEGLIHYVVLLALFLFAGVFSGAVLTPLLLPYLPGRAFALKSIAPSAAVFIALYFLLAGQISSIEIIAFGLISTALSAFAAMNFTGASTYTSISGVKKEMRIAVPIEIATALSGVILWIISATVA